MFKNRLREARRRAGLTQEKMADLMDISLYGYQKYELGESMPTIDNLLKLSHILGVTTDYLLCNDDRRIVDQAGSDPDRQCH